MAEMHNGSVEAFSRGPGHGSEFVVRIPAIVSGREEPSAAADPVLLYLPATNRRILVVDDNADAAETLAVILRSQGHEVRLAHDGLAALELAQTFNPDTVLLDIGLPGLDGYEVARRLRALPGGGRLTMTAITGYGQDEDRVNSRNAGFDHHLTKPVDPKVLCDLLNQRSSAVAEQTSA
jgi:CheY-like chemotaxis protein